MLPAFVSGTLSLNIGKDLGGNFLPKYWPFSCFTNAVYNVHNLARKVDFINLVVDNLFELIYPNRFFLCCRELTVRELMQVMKMIMWLSLLTRWERSLGGWRRKRQLEPTLFSRHISPSCTYPLSRKQRSSIQADDDSLPFNCIMDLREHLLITIKNWGFEEGRGWWKTNLNFLPVEIFVSPPCLGIWSFSIFFSPPFSSFAQCSSN